MTELPYAADAEDSLTYDELEVLRLQYEKELTQGHASVQTKFNYAWGLIKAPERDHQAKGVKLMQDIYKTEALRRRECLYYISLGLYKMQEYSESQRYIEMLLSKEPRNLQAQSLKELIDKAVTKDGYIGMALVGGAAAIGTLLLASLVRSNRR
ncbi:mitochondrial membrane protein [Tulasnella sp. 424]|nr:mitochondrial membrane protein [Tulasnella sp. 424]KAG8974437.1 mitochondrial membrane protein [Tulasnella sp. 425]